MLLTIIRVISFSLTLELLWKQISSNYIFYSHLRMKSLTHCVVFIIIIIIVSLFVIIRIIAVVVRIQPFVLKGTCLSHFDIIFFCDIFKNQYIFKIKFYKWEAYLQVFNTQCKQKRLWFRQIFFYYYKIFSFFLLHWFLFYFFYYYYIDFYYKSMP